MEGVLVANVIKIFSPYVHGRPVDWRTVRPSEI